MNIPIQNIYYLLCYAWNKLKEKELVNIDRDHRLDFLELLARILKAGTKQVLLRGLDKSYVEFEAVIPGIRGKFQLQESLGKNRLALGKASCVFDEFSPDVLHNQIIKTTLRRLIRTKNLAADEKTQLMALYRRMGNIAEIDLNAKVFSLVRLNRNNRQYGFPLKVCELIYLNTIPSENEGPFIFQDFRRDPLAMAALFEEFVRKFLQLHFRDLFYSIGREKIKWKVENADSSVLRQVPVMETDITLQSPHRKIIIDTKFYQEAYLGKGEKLHPGNLYQLYSYLKNQENPADGPTMACEGILLYPQTGKPLNLKFELDGHPVSVKTIDLDQDWQLIHEGLLRVLE